MSHVAKTPFDLTLHMVSVGGNSDGGWIPGNGYPAPEAGRVGQRYVDVQTGHIYGPKTRTGWPAEFTHTLNLGNVAGEFANMLSRVPKLEVLTTNQGQKITALEGRADSAADLAISHHATLQEHELRLDTLDASTLEIQRRIGMVDGTLSARMLVAEEDLGRLRHLRDVDLADQASKISTLETSLRGNSSSLTQLQESFTGFSESWTQEVTTLRTDFNGNIATLQQTIHTHADRFSATSTRIDELTATVGSNTATLTEQARVTANEFSALSQQLSTMSAQFNGNVATITAQQTAMANDMEAYASSVEFLGSEVEGAKASVTEAVETLTTADQALAHRVSTLDTAAGDLAGRITNEETARVNADSAVLTAARSLVTTAESGLTAKVNDEAAARLSGDQAEAYQRSLLDTKFTTANETLRTNLQASISAEATARANAIAAETNARNQAVSTLNGSIGQVSAAVTAESQTRATVDGYLGARTTLTTSTTAAGHTAVAGMEIASTSSAGRQSYSYIGFFADNFYITHTQGATERPFEVVGGVVKIKTAMIQNASITSAHIQDGNITNAKIGWAAIDGTQIQDAAITNAKIANLSVDTIKIQDRAVTTMATAIAGGTNANSLINGGYGKYAGDWRRPSLVALGCANGYGSEAIVIWVSIKAMVNGTPGFSDDSTGTPAQPSGWGISVIRGDGTTVFTSIFPQAGGGSVWWAGSTGEDQLISVVDVPPVGYHTYTVVLNGSYSHPDNRTFYFSQLSMTVLNAKK